MRRRGRRMGCCRRGGSRHFDLVQGGQAFLRLVAGIAVGRGLDDLAVEPLGFGHIAAEAGDRAGEQQ